MVNFKQVRKMFFNFQKVVWLFLSATWGLGALLIGVTGLVNSKDISNPTESVTTTPEMLETAQKITIFGLSVTGIIILSLVVWLAFFTNKDRNDDSVQERKINVTTVPDTTLKDKGELQ